MQSLIQQRRPVAMAESSEGSEPKLTSSIPQRLLAKTLRALVWLLGFTFLRVNQFYGACIGQFLYVFGSEIKRITRTNLAIAYPDHTESQRESLVKNSLVELGKTIVELGPLWSWNRRRINSLITEVRGQEVMDEAQGHGRGVIVLVPHFGAWELVGLHLSLQYNVVSLYRPPRLQGVGEFMRQARQRFGAKLVPTNLTGVRAVRCSLKKGQMVGILPDQDPGANGGVRAPFFGYSARTMLLVSRMAAKSKCKIVYLAAERLPRGQGFRLHYLPADPEIASTNDLVAATALNAGVEQVIKIAPAQYQWSYKRFRGTINGQLDPYKQGRQSVAHTQVTAKPVTAEQAPERSDAEPSRRAA